MIAITKRPQVKITGDSLNTSKWVGVHQPVEFHVQRKDYTITSKGGVSNQQQNDGSVIALTWFRVLTVSGISNGDTVTFMCGPEEKKRSFTLKVAKIFPDTTNTYSFIFFDLNNIVDAHKITDYKAYINVSRKSYYIECFVYQSYKNESLELAGVVKSKTDVWGRGSINIQKVLSSNIVNYNKGTYDKINEKVFDSGGIYNIKLREVYEGFIGEFTTLLDTDNLFYVNGSKQLQEENGYNFGEFVPTLNDSRTNKAKFLSVFNKPTYFKGYPFDLSFIWSDNLVAKQITRHEDINGLGSPTSTDLLMSGRGFVNRLMLSGSFASTVKTLNVWLESGGNTNQNPSTGTGTLTGVGTVFNPIEGTIKHRLEDLQAWRERYDNTSRPIIRNERGW